MVGSKRYKRRVNKKSKWSCGCFHCTGNYEARRIIKTRVRRKYDKHPIKHLWELMEED